MNMMFTMTMSCMILAALTTLSISLMKTMKNMKNESAFECGFNPFKTIHTPFSSQFFMIAVLFLIFDVEISMFLPLMKNQNSPFTSILPILFLSTLTWGFMIEWKEGTVKWSK